MKQEIDVTLSSHNDALEYAKELERRDFNVSLKPRLVGSNWFFDIKAAKDHPND